MTLQFVLLPEAELPIFIREMQMAFERGAASEGDLLNEELPESHVRDAFYQEDAITYKVMRDHEMVGGVILEFEPNEPTAYLVFFYVKAGLESQGLGKEIWHMVECTYPKISKWETYTPYQWKRNIHFYVNVCGFHITEFFNAYHVEADSEHAGEEYLCFVKNVVS